MVNWSTRHLPLCISTEVMENADVRTLHEARLKSPQSGATCIVKEGHRVELGKKRKTGNTVNPVILHTRWRNHILQIMADLRDPAQTRSFEHRRLFVRSSRLLAGDNRKAQDDVQG